MLILTRKIGESLIIGDDIVVTTLDIKGNQVRLGIDAPEDVTVYREEVYERIKAGLSKPRKKSSEFTEHHKGADKS